MTTPAIQKTTNLEAGVRISCAPVYATAGWEGLRAPSVLLRSPLTGHRGSHRI